MSTTCKRKWSALVLAASRGPHDPMAKAFEVKHKCLLPIVGKPMIAYVIETLRQHPQIATIAISIEDATALTAALGEQLEGIEILKAESSAPGSVAAAFEALSPPGNLLVTTADHPLLSREMLDHFLNASQKADADLTAGLARAETILAAYPQAKRTFLRFGPDRVSGCNLFALKTPAAKKALTFWRNIEKNRKNPFKLVSAFGPGAIVAFLTGQLSLKRAFAIASRRMGITAIPVEMPQANAAVDVDKPEDLELVRSILSKLNL